MMAIGARPGMKATARPAPSTSFICPSTRLSASDDRNNPSCARCKVHHQKAARVHRPGVERQQQAQHLVAATVRWCPVVKRRRMGRKRGWQGMDGNRPAYQARAMRPGLKMPTGSKLCCGRAWICSSALDCRSKHR